MGPLGQLPRGGEQRRPLGVLVDRPGLGAGRLDLLAGQLQALAGIDGVVARVARCCQHVGDDVQLATLERRQALQQAHERLLGGVGGVVGVAQQSHAEPVHALLMAVVQLRERLPVARDRGASEILVAPCPVHLCARRHAIDPTSILA